MPLSTLCIRPGLARQATHDPLYLLPNAKEGVPRVSGVNFRDSIWKQWSVTLHPTFA